MTVRLFLRLPEDWVRLLIFCFKAIKKTGSGDCAVFLIASGLAARGRCGQPSASGKSQWGSATRE